MFPPLTGVTRGCPIVRGQESRDIEPITFMMSLYLHRIGYPHGRNGLVEMLSPKTDVETKDGLHDSNINGPDKFCHGFHP